MKTNINAELFKRYAPKKKLEIIESLTQEELLAITPATITRIVKEAGTGKKGSTNKDLRIRRDLREGNNWNSTFEGVGVHSKKLYVSLYVQMDSTDTENTEYYNTFISGERYRGTCQESDRFGNPNYHYFFYDNEDRAACIKSILLEYVYTKYADKLKD